MAPNYKLHTFSLLEQWRFLRIYVILSNNRQIYEILWMSEYANFSMPAKKKPDDSWVIVLSRRQARLSQTSFHRIYLSTWNSVIIMILICLYICFFFHILQHLRLLSKSSLIFQRQFRGRSEIKVDNREYTRERESSPTWQSQPEQSTQSNKKREKTFQGGLFKENYL